MQAIVGAAALVVVPADAAVGHAITGALALAVMLVASAALVLHTARAVRARRGGALLVLLATAVVCFVVARAWALVSQGTGRAYDALVTYDLVWLALAGTSTATLWAGSRFVSVLRSIQERPRRALAGSFLLLIVVTTLCLTLPIAVHDVGSVSLVDALFTATSAVCVTGLSVNDVGATYTYFGQAVILVAIQLGGIGIMTLAALAVTALRGRVADETRYARMLEADSLAELRAMVRGVVVGTLAFEAAGTFALFTLWAGRADLAEQPVLWLAVFHAVSAFCNAGFSLFTTNLAPFTNDAPTQLVIAALVVVGGLGFPVWRGLTAHAGRRLLHVVKRDAARPLHVDLGARVALAASAVLLAVGTAAFAILEWTHGLSTLSAPSRLLNAFFCAVTVRTAGFNTVGIDTMRDATLLVAMALMFVGGSPGSTAGGIKTTTAAILGSVLRAEIRGEQPRLWGRAVAADLVRRAVAVVGLACAAVFVALVALCLTEVHPLRALAFEAVSAITTTGLSTGITADLSSLGKLVLVATMFAGRIGPLALAIAFASARRPSLHRLPEETLPVG